MGDALSELKKILTDIREKTGCEVRVSPSENAETCFSVDYRGQSMQVYVDGDPSQTQTTVRMIQYLVDTADARRLFPEKAEAIRSILLGEGGDWYVYRFMTKYALPENECFAIDVCVDKRLDDAMAHIESCNADTKDMVVRMDDFHCAIVKFADNTNPEEFAQFIAQSLYEELGVKAKIGVGGECKNFVDIATSYHQAATALRMSGVFRSKGDVHSYKEFLLVRVLEEVPEARLREYFEQLQISDGNEIFEDEELVGTAEEFLENSLNISETSRDLYMHRNTLMYRLDKIERITGLNIRKFSDAVSFRVIMILYKLLHLA